MSHRRTRWLVRHGVARWSLAAGALVGNPLAQLMFQRARTDQVHRLQRVIRERPLSGGRVAMATSRYDVAAELLRSNDFEAGASSSAAARLALQLGCDPGSRGPFDEPSLLVTDPPVHTRLRRLVSSVFTPPTLARPASRRRAAARPEGRDLRGGPEGRDVSASASDGRADHREGPTVPVSPGSGAAGPTSAAREEGRGRYEPHGGPSLARIARLLTAYGADPDTELVRLLERATFTVAIGDADAHGKNISLLHPTPEHITLAPPYGAVPTALWPRLRPTAAMLVNGRTILNEVTAEDLTREARHWGLGSQRAAATVRDVCERLRAAAPPPARDGLDLASLMTANLDGLAGHDHRTKDRLTSGTPSEPTLHSTEMPAAMACVGSSGDDIILPSSVTPPGPATERDPL